MPCPQTPLKLVRRVGQFGDQKLGDFLIGFEGGDVLADEMLVLDGGLFSLGFRGQGSGVRGQGLGDGLGADGRGLFRLPGGLVLSMPAWFRLRFGLRCFNWRLLHFHA